MRFRGPEKRRRLWCIMDLVTDPISGRLAETKVWANAGKALMCWVVWHEAIQGQLTEPLLLWFAVAVLGHEAVTRFMNMKREKDNIAQPASESTTTTTTRGTP